MNPLTLNGNALLAVDVPEDAYCFEISIEEESISFLFPDGDWDIIDIPHPGNWSILGRLNDITEERAAGLVDGKGGLYKDYMALDNGYEYDLLATESLQSFFRSHGVDGNPLILILNN